MKRFAKGLIGTTVGLFLATSFAGAVSGTVAWYAYVTRVEVTYQGTSVSNAERIQIGLKSNYDFRFDGEGHDLGFNLTKEDVDGQTYDYYWANPGSGFSAEAIQAYLSKLGMATTELAPVTTREYIMGTTDFHLYQNPSFGVPLPTGDANPQSYCKIDFVFRALLTSGSGTAVYAENEPIWLSDCVAEAAGGPGQHINEALRLYFEGENDFIIKPTAESVDGATNVSGALCLVRDGVYDVGADGYEIIYGDYTETLANMKAKAHEVTSVLAEGHYNDINGIYSDDPAVEDVTEEPSTFLGKHKLGTYGYTKAKLAERGTKVAQYYSKATVAPDDDGSGHLSDGKILCRTSSRATGAVGNVSMTIYLEGWDFSVVNKEISHAFNLGLQFQIDRS